jgi:hypothetical protein
MRGASGYLRATRHVPDTTATSTRQRGTNPRGWLADVAYLLSAENRSHGSSMGIKLRRSLSR